MKATDNIDVRAFRGDTVRRLTDRIAFGEVNVVGYARILIHVGSNDISDFVSRRHPRSTTFMHVLDRFGALRNTIRRKNSSALLLFSSVLPRKDDYALFKPYIQGLNFALAKICAKTGGTNIFVPSYRAFLKYGEPRPELFADNDGLHLSGAGVVMLESCFQQALSTGYLMLNLKSKSTRKLSQIPY